MTTISICRKKSGNLVLTQFAPQAAWELVATASTPKELKSELRKLKGTETIILAEYSQSQLKELVCNVSDKQILKAFEISATKSNIELYFN